MMLVIDAMYKILSLEFEKFIHLVADMIDCIHGFRLEGLHLHLLHLQLFDLLELLVQLLMEGVQDSGLEGEGSASHSEYTGWQYFSRKKHKDVRL